MPDIDKVDMEKRRKAAFEKLPSRLRTLTNSIRNRLEKQNSGFIELAHDIGEEIAEVQDEAGKYPVADPIGLMSVALAIDDRPFLLRCARFYRLVKQETLSWLVSQRTKSTNRPITWTHIIHLLSVDQASASEANFKKYAKMVFAEDLSPQELQARLCQELREGVKNNGGRPIAIPAKLPAKLENMDKVLGVLLRNHHQFWAHDDHGIERAVKDLPADQLNDDVISAIERRQKLAKEAQAVLENDLVLLERAKLTARQRMADRDKPSADEDDVSTEPVVDMADDAN